MRKSKKIGLAVLCILVVALTAVLVACGGRLSVFGPEVVKATKNHTVVAASLETTENQQLFLDNFSVTKGEVKLRFFAPNETNQSIEVELARGLVDSGVTVSAEKGVLKVQGKRNTVYETDSVYINIYGSVDRIDVVGALVMTIDAASWSNETKTRTIAMSGATEIKGEGLLKCNTFNLLSSGASKGDFNVECDQYYSELSGACKVTMRAVTKKTIEQTVSGAGVLIFSGSAKDISLLTTGACTVNAFNLSTETATVDGSGASKMEISVSEKLDATLSGACSLRYKGSPEVTRLLSGAASLKQEKN